MAIKKSIGINKIYYGVVSEIFYFKNNLSSFALDLYVCDTDEFGNIVGEKVHQNRLDYRLSIGYPTPDMINPLGENHVKYCYDWIRSNIALFDDFIDC